MSAENFLKDVHDIFNVQNGIITLLANSLFTNEKGNFSECSKKCLDSYAWRCGDLKTYVLPTHSSGFITVDSGKYEYKEFIKLIKKEAKKYLKIKEEERKRGIFTRFHKELDQLKIEICQTLLKLEEEFERFRRENLKRILHNLNAGQLEIKQSDVESVRRKLKSELKELNK